MKYEDGWQVFYGTEEDHYGAILIQGVVEISDKSMVTFIHGQMKRSVPNCAVYRKKKDALRELKRYLVYGLDTCNEQMKTEGVQDVDSGKMKSEELKRINLFDLIDAYCDDFFNKENLSCQQCPFHLPSTVLLPDGNSTICMKPFILLNRKNKNEVKK